MKEINDILSNLKCVREELIKRDIRDLVEDINKIIVKIEKMGE